MSRYLILMPSFYGFLMLALVTLLYQWWPLELTPLSVQTLTVLMAGLVLFLLSMLVHARAYAQAGGGRLPAGSALSPAWARRIEWGLHGVGLLGVAIQLRGLAIGMGGTAALWHGFLHDWSSIRHAGATVATLGIQLSYAGWLGMFYSLIRQLRDGSARGESLALMLLQFAANLLFADRTRPIWLLFLLFYLLLGSRLRRMSLLRLSLWLLGASVSALAFFVLIGRLLKKVSAGAQGMADGVGHYLFAGLAYFNAMLAQPAGNFVPSSILTPLFRVLAMLGLAAPPPDLILPFRNVPFSSNVGTFLQPFYHDGGYVYVAIGLVLHAFVFDRIGLCLLRNGRTLALFALANLCFVDFIAWFTPKINNLSIWLFVLPAVGLLAWQSLRSGRGRP